MPRVAVIVKGYPRLSETFIAQEILGLERRGIEVYRSASRSVVHITTAALRRDFFFQTFEVPQGSGTGFFWDRDGHVVTNYHVVEGANQYEVTLSDHSDWPAELVGVEQVVPAGGERVRIARFPLLLVDRRRLHGLDDVRTATPDNVPRAFLRQRAKPRSSSTARWNAASESCPGP